METEAKIRVPSLAALKRRISGTGGRLLSARSFEANTLFDTPGGLLRSAGKSFRIRRYGTVGTVTLKGVARVEGGLKSRVELETEVASPEVLAQILVSLGFTPQFRYEKFREVWSLGRTVICLDKTPLGPIVEIEGAARDIHRAAALLGLRPEEFLSKSYPALWVESGHPGDMVFPKNGKRRRRVAAAKPRARGRA